MSDVSTSKFLSLILRHNPATVGITLDSAGWVEVGVLLEALKKHGHDLSRASLDNIVATNNKKRFEYSPDNTKIRACQGHSLKDVDLQLEEKTPPDILYHGTASRFLDSIFEKGLLPGNRQYVHLSLDVPTAVKVGQRHGISVVLHVDAIGMYKDGFKFYLSHNNVWLTKTVPPQYLSNATNEKANFDNVLKSNQGTQYNKKPLDVRGIPMDSAQGKIDTY